MKRKLLILFMMITTIMLWSFAYTVPLIAASGSSNPCANGHKYTGWSTIKYAKCESSGTKRRDCYNCDAYQEETIPALGHDWGDWKDHNNSVHRKTCNRCDDTEDESHSGGSWYDVAGDMNYHYKDCSTCGHEKYDKEAHNNNAKFKIAGNPNQHDTYCDISYKVIYMGLEDHSTWAYGAYPGTAHTCAGPENGCGYVRTSSDGYPYHSFGIGTEITTSNYNNKCQLDGCTVRYGISTNPWKGAKDLAKYTCVGSSETYVKDTPIENGTEYDIVMKYVETDESGTPVENLKFSDRYLQLVAYRRGNFAEHSALLDRNHSLTYIREKLTTKATDEGRANISSLAEAYYNMCNNIVIDYVRYKIVLEYFSEWGEAFDVIEKGSIVKATQTYSSSDKTISVSYSGLAGRYYMANAMLFGSYLNNGALFICGSDGGPNGGYSDDSDPYKILANVYVCYRTTDGDIPKNGYESIYEHSSVTVYETKNINASVTVSADLDKIDNTGYRYVGYKVAWDKIGPTGYSSSYKTSKTSVTLGLSYVPRKTLATVTFYVEPVKLSYGHKSVDYNGNEQNIVASSQTGSGVEFPDYYDADEGKCKIPVTSLNKFAWPGYILERSKAVKYRKESEEYWKKTYDEKTTTWWGPNEDGKYQWTISEDVYSFYDNETDGFAADKQFYFYYNTPTIDIIHADYDLYNSKDPYNESAMLKDKNNNALTYKMQILNQYAYIESLVTDNVGLPHTLTVSLADGKIKTFEYEHPTRDLVQIEIYEITNSGREIYYGTLYEDQEYEVSDKGRQITDYEGVFAKYYSDTLISIADKLNADDFNTSKNWRVVFKYRPVERVYIRFMDLKGNSIFIPDPNKEGAYIGEITAKIPKDVGYTYVVEDLGTNGKFKALLYTEATEDYIKDHNVGTPITAGEKITVPGKTGDRYIVIFYSTEKRLTVEYRDTKENTIKPSITMEIPSTGTVIDIPEIPLYDIKEYKHNPNYDGIGDIIGNDSEGNPIHGISGDARPLTELDTQITVPNPNETDQHIIIYYEANEALKVEYRDISGDVPIAVPPEYVTTTMIEIPEAGVRVEVPVVPTYTVKYYKHNPNYNGTDTTIDGNTVDLTNKTSIPVSSNGNNQYIIIYYEKSTEPSTKLTIEYREDDPTGDELRPSVTIDIPNGEETPIVVPDITGYEYDYYVESGDSTPKDILPENPIIIVIGDPDKGDQKVIIVYVKEELPPEEEPDNPTIITPDDNKEKVYLKANKKGAEEYDVEVAVPTSEDLYVSGDLYSYRFVSEMEKVEFEENVNVEIHQQYYTDLDRPDDLESIKVKETVKLNYRYFDILRAELYDLKSMELVNGAIKYYNGYNYDTNEYGIYQEGKATFPVSKQVPTFVYNSPQGVGMSSDNRVQITGNEAYQVTYRASDNTYVIKIKDIDYYEAINKDAVENQLRNEAEAILEKCTQIKIQTLAIRMPGEDDVEILTGKTYDLPKKTDALESTEYYIPYVAGRAPLYSFCHDKDLYVQEKATNKIHQSSMTGNYRLIESIPYETNQAAITVTSHNPINGTRLEVEKINVNSINIHTPIVNKVTLTPSDDNKKVTQLNSTLLASVNGMKSVENENVIILNLDEEFTIEIPNVGNHINQKGYGDSQIYNHSGLSKNGTEEQSRLEAKSEDKLAAPGIIKNNNGIASVNTSETEKDWTGPAFAEYKLIRFPYDVYLMETNAASPSAGKPQLFKANEWYNLYEYVQPGLTKYKFMIPVWVKDATAYMNQDAIHVLTVAENCDPATLEAAMNSTNIIGTVKNLENNEANKDKTYILRKTFNTYVSGRVYDLQIRDTDDPGYMGKVKPALNLKTLPLAQQGQVAGYNMGLKLGYRFYFDLKTKGISNTSVGLRPKIYYVPAAGGTATDQISLFYKVNQTTYKKLTTADDLNVKMVFTTTHGIVNNAGYTAETVSAKQMVGTRVFNNPNVIGQLVNGLVLKSATEKLPYDNIAEEAGKTGFGTDITSFVASAAGSKSISDADPATRNDIKNSTGHWYGEYYLPASTVVISGTTATPADAMAGKNVLKDGYLIVTFEEITTGTDATGKGYLTYDAPTGNAQWQKEEAHQTIKLPNGKSATVQTRNNANPTQGTSMAIYQVGLRAHNDFETEGTH